MEERLRRLSFESNGLIHIMALYETCPLPIELFEWPETTEQFEKNILESLSNEKVNYSHILNTLPWDMSETSTSLAKKCLIWLQKMAVKHEDNLIVIPKAWDGF